MPYQVKLTYFKQSGKYYSEGEYESSREAMWEIFEEVRQMQRGGKLPGLCKGGGSEFIILVTAEGHPNEYPGLVVPEGVCK